MRFNIKRSLRDQQTDDTPCHAEKAARRFSILTEGKGEMSVMSKTAVCGLLLTALQAACASPTSADFEVCHRAAAAALEQCLDRHTGPNDDMCWSDARKTKRRCYADVNEKYARHPVEDRKKAEAARKATEAAMTRMQQESK